jgi:hypothetical protein
MTGVKSTALEIGTGKKSARRGNTAFETVSWQQ